MLEWEDGVAKSKQPVAHVEGSERRVSVSDKRIINAKTDVNQLVPFKYNWAWDAYLNSSNNNWMPSETFLQDDLQEMDALRADATLYDNLLLSLGSLSVFGSVQQFNPGVHVYRHCSAPECRQFLLRQNYEAAQHGTAQYQIVTELRLEDSSYDQRFRSTVYAESIIKQFEEYYGKIAGEEFATGTVDADQKFFLALVVMYGLQFGVYGSSVIADFPALLAEARRLKGVREIYTKIRNDRERIVNFGYELIRALLRENPHVWTQEIQHLVVKLIDDAVALEHSFAQTERAKMLASAAGNAILKYMRLAERFKVDKVAATVIEQPKPLSSHEASTLQWD